MAAEIGYAPSLLATSLRQKQVPFFGVFFEFVRRGDAAPDGGQSIMMWQVCEGIANAARQDRRYPVVLTSPNPASGMAASTNDLDMIVRSGLAGVIAAVHPETWTNHVARWEEAGVPCISLFDAGSPDAPRWSVDLDNRAVGRLPGSTCSGTAIVRVLCLHQGESWPAATDRMEAFGQAVRESGGDSRVEYLALTREQVRQVDDGESGCGQALVDSLRQSGATAVFCPDGGASVISYQVLTTRGLHVPDRYSIVGIDIPLWHGAATVVTEVACSGTLVGQAAAKLLSERIADGSDQARHVQVPPVLIERSSVGRV